MLARLFLFFLSDPFVWTGRFNGVSTDGEEAKGGGVANAPLTIAGDMIFTLHVVFILVEVDLCAAFRIVSGGVGDCIGGFCADNCDECSVWDGGFNRNDCGGGNHGLSGEQADWSEGGNELFGGDDAEVFGGNGAERFGGGIR